MKKILSLILIFMSIANTLLISVSFSVDNKKVAIKKTGEIKTKSKTESAIEHWKKKKQLIIKNIYAQTNISSLMDLSQAASQLKEISWKLENIWNTYRTIKAQKRNIDKKYKEILEEAKSVVKSLNARKVKLQWILFKMQVLTKDLENLKKQLQEIKDSIYISKKQVEKYITILYKINNDYYSSNAGLDNIKLLFKSNKNIAKALSQEEIIKILSIQTKNLISKLEQAEKRKRDFLRKVYLKRAEYVNLVNQYNSEIKILNDKKKILVDMFTMLKSNKKEIDNYYNKLYKQRINLKKQQIKLTKSLSKKIEENAQSTGDDIKAKPIDLSDVINHTIKNDWDKFLNWPTKDAIVINAYYHDENYKKKFGWEHDGIDIRLKQGSPIYAAAAWYVYKVVDNDSDYYNYIILVHNYWYITLYGHISKSLVKEWQIVERWQIIALSWWTKWTRWAWKLSTWPHLHFEAWKNGQHIDPFSAMDLSVYPNKKYLPLKWRIKYMKDNITRKIDLSNVKMYSFKLKHKEREKQFLKRAAPAFQNPDLWINAWKKYGIDPDVAICIAYAESGLWNNTTTKNNIWNVWNNDRWDRIGLSSPQAGINSIYYTLNNKYLSKYHTIYSLSRYGNKDSHIYSSSTYNWYKNVVKCLSKIKWYPIDEYYPFRTISDLKLKELEKKYDNLR